MKEKLQVLKKSAKQFPSLPGVYFMKRGEDEILYVGKAKSLKSRVLSYFNKTMGLKTEFLLKKTERIEYLLTENEVEAFLLEASLIKRHKPRYNIRLKDDKAYPYIRFAMAVPFPRFYFERRVKVSKDIYFGPYTEGFNVRHLLEFLNQNFLLRDCSDSDFKTRKRACLNFNMGICSAPCVQKINQKDYAKACKKALSFLNGRSKSLVKQLQIDMKQASRDLKFELAGKMRDRLQAIERIEMSQVVVQKTNKDKDVVVLQSLEGKHLIEILHFRQGRLIGNRFQLMKLVDAHSLLSFLNQYYFENLVPDELILDLDLKVSECRLLSKVLSQKRQSSGLKDSKCLVISKLDRENSLLVKRAKTNALNHLKDEIQKADLMKEHLKEIQKKFHLKTFPYRIECYDISHWQGASSVGSGVVFENGEALKKEYRRYHLKSVPEGDDYLALQEVLSRRLTHKEWDNPDLILIDGGRGQLSAVKSILDSMGKKEWAVVGLAKDRIKGKNRKRVEIYSTGERFFLPGRKNPVLFPNHSKALKILLQLRDEAHRFAIQSHRKKREKTFFKSDLDSIKGLGKKTKEKLLKKGIGLKKIKSMTEKELARLNFISPSLAKRIKQTLK